MYILGREPPDNNAYLRTYVLGREILIDPRNNVHMYVRTYVLTCYNRSHADNNVHIYIYALGREPPDNNVHTYVTYLSHTYVHTYGIIYPR